MIVEDKKASIEAANASSDKLLNVIIEEVLEFHSKDDPAEQIYLCCHIVGNLFSKICMALEGYGKVYAIPNLTCDSIKEWINVIAAEHIKANKE